MEVLPNLIKNKWDNIEAFCKCTPYMYTILLQRNQPASSYWYLQDHAARSSLSPVSPFPGQVPADQKARQQSSTQDQLRVWMIHKHYKTCMTRNHALMMNFYLQDMQALWYLCMSKHESIPLYINQPDVAFEPTVYSFLWNSEEQTPQHPRQCQHPCKIWLTCQENGVATISHTSCASSS